MNRTKRTTFHSRFGWFLFLYACGFLVMLLVATAIHVLLYEVSH